MRCENDVEFALKLQLLSAAAYALRMDVVNAFVATWQDNVLPPEVQPFMSNYEDTWIAYPQKHDLRHPSRFVS